VGVALHSQFSSIMEEEKDAFYVVRKGDIIGVYNNFSDCQLQAQSSSVNLPFLLLNSYLIFKEQRFTIFIDFYFGGVQSFCKCVQRVWIA